MDLEHQWQILKETLNETPKETCGSSRKTNRIKRTELWNKDSK